jgi:hypothetical protein
MYYRISPDAAKRNSPEVPMHDTPTGPAAMATTNKKRPRLDLNAGDPRERKRGKSMFGLVLGTLNKAKVEDKERNASDAVGTSSLLLATNILTDRPWFTGEKTTID